MSPGHPIRIPTPAERAFEKLREIHLRTAAGVSGPDELPAWFVLTPSGSIRIKTIGERSPFVMFVTPEGDQLFMAPETVAVVLRKLPAESREARFAVGFAQPESAAEPPDVGYQSLRGPDKTRD